MKDLTIKKNALKVVATLAKPKKANPNLPFECIALLHQPKRPQK